jgi:GTP-binding protein LepA
MLVRVMDGQLRRRQRVRLMARRTEHEVQQLHVIDPHLRAVDALAAGEVGVVIAGLKTLDEVRIGDTVTDARHPAAGAQPGFREV